MDRVGDYLRLPESYCGPLGGLRWSPTGEAIEYLDGATFAFNGELALFLEGFASGGRLIHFGFILHLLHLLRRGRAPRPAEAQPLAWAFNAVSPTPLRNAGAFCAMLCRDMLAVADPIDPQAVCRRLSSGPLMHSLYVTWLAESEIRPVELPYLEPAAFEARVLAGLRPFSNEELRSWMQHGRGPVKQAGEEVARQLAALQPRTLAEVLARLAQNPRLSGAVPFVAQLVSALALPPRRLARPELPLGGYADVATRGEPEHLLPSQFALDDLEFLRRYAEKELLYFRREEPHARTEEELVVLLDQGVRTWGDVRLLLGAAVFAFGRLAARRGRPFRVAATSAPAAPLDPLEAGEEALAELLEASDLGPHPGLALERVLEEPAAVARDIVLLTHPRNLAEADVHAAARRVGPGTRLFAVAADGHGDVQLSEVRHGTPVKLSRFRVDLTRPAPPPAVPATDAPPAVWKGDVEPVGFPFRLGIHTEVAHFGFDEAGGWLLTVTKYGMLHAWQVDGTRAEVLPRPWWSGHLAPDVESVLGVPGGFVLGIRDRDRLLAAHYDLARRMCKVHDLGAADGAGWKWFYFRAQHAVVVLERALCRGVDLTTGERTVGLAVAEPPTTRLGQACRAAQDLLLPPPQVHVVKPGELSGPGEIPIARRLFVDLDSREGKVILVGATPGWVPFRPWSDGLPVLRDCQILQAQLRGNTLGLVIAGGKTGHPYLRLFRGPAGVPLGEYRMLTRYRNFALANEGRRFAHMAGPCEVVVRDIAGDGKPVLVTRAAKGYPPLQVELGDGWLSARIGRQTHLFRWDRGPLEITRTDLDPAALRRTVLQPAGLSPPGRIASPAGGLPELLRYDPHRFVAAAWAGLYAVVDVFGHVILLDQAGRLVCVFFVFRDHALAWMPDGTRHGASALAGGPPTPGALEKIGKALRAAAQVPPEMTT
jgi:hypothetical protein